MKLEWMGDSTLLARDIESSRWRNAAHFAEALRATRPSGVKEIVCAFGSVALVCDLEQIASVRCGQTIIDWVDEVFDGGGVKASESVARQIEIPVRYDGEDLSVLSRQLQLSRAEIVRLHAEAKYRVLAVGFLPGFAYLGGLPEALHAPRRASPRTRVDAGSVGIGGPYTGVYPFASPGGWHLIGRTSLALFDPSTEVGALLRVGDVIHFRQAGA